MDKYRGVRAKGESIEISYQWKGKRHFKILSQRPTKTNLAQAARLRNELLERLKMGLVADDHINPSFGDLAQRFLNETDLTLSTRESYRNILNRYWMPFLQDIPIAAIHYKDLVRIANDIEFKTAKTKKNCFIPLRGVFRMAMYEDYIDHNPVAKFKPVKVQKPPIDPFTHDEKERILSELKTVNADAHLFFLLAFDCGFRVPSELNALTWRDYDGERFAINKGIVRRQEKASTKTNQARSVLATERVKQALRTYHTRFKKRHIFLNSIDGPYRDGDVFNDAWRTALAKLNIRHRRAYNCRHTYATHGMMAGARPEFLCKQLGHSLEIFFKTYAQWINSDADKVELAKLNAAHNNRTKPKQ